MSGGADWGYTYLPLSLYSGSGHPEKNLRVTQDGRACLSNGQDGGIGRAQIAYFRCTLSFKPVLLALGFSGAGHLRSSFRFE